MFSRYHCLRVAATVAAVFSLGACATQQVSAPPDFLLLGEVHDNPHGHRQRFDDLRERIENGWRPALAMEQFDRERQQDLRRAQDECSDADCVIRMAGGGRWDWQLYRPLIDLALKHRLPLLAANLSRTDAGRVVRADFPAAFDAATIEYFGLNEPLPPALLAAHARAIDEGHCGMAPRGMVEGMARAQIARDVWMAKTLLEQGAGVVLIAGNGHVRRDIGVPYWLRLKHADRIWSVAYIEPARGTQMVFDVTHIVEAHPRPDPCKAFGTRAR